MPVMLLVTILSAQLHFSFFNLLLYEFRTHAGNEITRP
ncbi:hypothetical protein MP213Fo_15350 [Pseudochrobactrum sp. MP213Fo]